ncbi:hypothetical protein GGS23DRAFT_115890 [Durotheca rogersii]|uniref:uncharacterized protein n=1 Tax=Durotheca rogersii TaxID=419775 RepID=UPI00221F5636|nr:uncharacterized protein GGS23DRAFT_115890 [Durotheca rogersii]KAI5862279.1 hypothetical protein GGS23DRAFT_115890 [Durotheca rogersii]
MLSELVLLLVIPPVPPGRCLPLRFYNSVSATQANVGKLLSASRSLPVYPGFSQQYLKCKQSLPLLKPAPCPTTIRSNDTSYTASCRPAAYVPSHHNRSLRKSPGTKGLSAAIPALRAYTSAYNGSDPGPRTNKPVKVRRLRAVSSTPARAHRRRGAGSSRDDGGGSSRNTNPSPSIEYMS